MATQLAASGNSAAPAAPFMLSRPPVDPDFQAAMMAAAVAENGPHDTRRNTRGRVSYFLCELANQLSQREGFDPAAEMPLTRYDISDQLDISLCKVKRVLALLSLSGALRTDGRTLQVLDWQRLCALAQVNPTCLSLNPTGDEDIIVATEMDRPVTSTTAAGEPACFV